jgi:hypothetical protein
MLKYLRIAVTALSLTACVLLVALWVRSYWWSDNFMLRLPNPHVFIIHSMYGQTDWYLSSGFKFSGTWTIEANTVARETEGIAGGPPSWLRQLSFFRLHRRPVSFPHWVLVLLFAIFAAAPWIRWSKRFSLRTLLIATTLVAVVLGAVIYLAR